MRIKEVKPSQRKKGRFLVILEDGDILRITEEELLRFGLRSGEELGEETLGELAEEAPLGRNGRPEEVAAALYFLASDESAFITGQVVGVNGGIVI